ncbi:MAG: histidine phosphatase family protein [Actinobacteria bacterium]|nr:histidine phosphatase family protein [Actinomycetota bacterium]MCG2801684.1 histidine phosphatase family protein [Cellulomonas sp.]
MAELILIRHGETEWSRTGRHTGRTDIPLTDAGRAQAAALAPWVAALAPVHTITSPLLRARDTAALAGLHATVDDRLVEWDYGAYEGLTAAQIQAHRETPWALFRDGAPPGATPGETLDQVAARAGALLADVTPLLADGPVALVAHGHLLRVLVTQWLGLPAQDGAMFVLDPASISTLGHEHGNAAVLTWNGRPRGE